MSNTPPDNVLSIPVDFPNLVNTEPVAALVDSGATENFIDDAFAYKLKLKPNKKSVPATLELIDGTLTPAVTHDIRLNCLINGKLESVLFQVTSLGCFPLVLGLPWLRQNNPAIDWTSGDITTGASAHSSSFNPNPIKIPQDSPLKIPQDAPGAPQDPPKIAMLGPSGFRRLLKQKDGVGSGAMCYTQEPMLAYGAHTSEKTDLTTLLPSTYHSFFDVFSKAKADTLPPHRLYDHRINVQDNAHPPFGPIYSLSAAELKALREYLDKNLAKGFIRPSESSAGAPILFVKKKDGSLRLCVDYRGLNNVTIKNRYPLPLINELLDRLSSAKIFTKIDLRGAYNLLRIAEGDKWKTAFRTRYGLFEYLVMPFGLTNAPASFQHLMNNTFHDMLDNFVIIYLDDILIYSKDLETHEDHVKQVLARLRKAGLYAKAEKCEFHQTKTDFLGFVISDKGVSMDPKKIKTITNWPVPSSTHDVQVFLGFANFYRRFITNYSKIALPLSKLLRKENAGKNFEWTPQAQHSFETLRNSFTSDNILQHFDPSLPITLETDASDFAVGAVLSQTFPDNLRHPIAFFSKKMDPAQCNYEIHDKELLAIVLAFKNWRHYLEGSAHDVQVLTDHRSLEYFKTSKQLNRRQARWSEFLADFNFTITYRPGTLGGQPDALTRRSDMQPHSKGASLTFDNNPKNHQILLKPHHFRLSAAGTLSIVSSLSPHLLSNYPQDQYTATLLQEAEENALKPDFSLTSEGLLTFKDKVIIPDCDNLRLDIVKDRHNSLIAGHPGRKKTIDLVTCSFYWPGMRKFIQSYVDTCETCKRTKSTHHRAYGNLKSLPIPPHPWSSISMDMIEQLPPSSGFDAILVVVDRLTKMALFIPTTTLVTSEELARLYLRHVFSKHGLPSSIVSDRGSEFTSRFWRSFTALMGVENHFGSAYHPQTDGQTERVNQCLEQYLRCFSDHLQDNWSDLLPLAEFSYNNTSHSATTMSPFFVNKGYHPTAFFSTNEPPSPDSITSPAAQSYADELKNLHKFAQEEISKAQAQSAQQYDKKRQPAPNFQEGDKVWLSAENIRSLRPTKKLDHRQLGPFPVAKKVNSHAYRLDLPPSMKIHNVFHVSRLEPYQPNTIPNRIQPPPPPIEIENDIEYEVEAILDSKIDRRYRSEPLRYLVRWSGYSGPEATSWEPPSNLENCPDLVQVFHQRNPTKPSPLSLSSSAT